MQLSDVIRKSVTVGPQDGIVDAARTMRSQGTSSALVVDAGTIVGVLTERDLMVKVVAENRSPADLRVCDTMSDVGATASLADLLGSPVSSLEDAEGVYEIALTGAPIDLAHLPGIE